MSHEDYPGPRRPEFIAYVGDTSIVLTYENAQVNYYLPPWSHLGHVAISGSELPHEGRVFGDNVLAHRLFILDYPVRIAPYADPHVVDAYVDWQASCLARELGEGL